MIDYFSPLSAGPSAGEFRLGPDSVPARLADRFWKLIDRPPMPSMIMKAGTDIRLNFVELARWTKE
jgi:hypothetical protein